MIAYPQSIDFDFYRSYHQNPFNKAIHLVCIPMLSLCFLNFASMVGGDKYLLYFYSAYYTFISLKVGVVMTTYLYLLFKLANLWRTNNIYWRENSVFWTFH